MFFSSTGFLALLHSWLLPRSHALAASSPTSPHVQLDHATVLGRGNGSVESFLGILFAQPPVGDLRFRLPQLIDSYDGTVNATAFGNQCIQQATALPSDLPSEVLEAITPYIGKLFEIDPVAPQSEDCLNLNIIRPANVSAKAKLPVLFWIYGGAFAIGSNAIVNLFGFLGGAEVKEAAVGNLGLQDQRAALQWVQKHISAFGGDPGKVTIWGESAGSASVFFHLFANGGDPQGLFRAAIMSSGSSVPTKDILELQGTYDFVVEQVGCSNATDTLACLRTVSTDSLLAAANQTPSPATSFVGVNTPFITRADGVFIKDFPQQLALHGKMADVPFIMGTMKDEGTMFSLGNANITTDDEFAGYISQNFFPGSSPADLEEILTLYPSDPAAGSPFDTGSANAFTPEYKRFAALTGDWFVEAPRRQLLERFSSNRTAYNFLSSRVNVSPLGYPHGHDLFVAFAPGDITDYFIRFVNNLDPNGVTGVQWPRYDTTSRATLHFNDGEVPLSIAADDERLAGTRELTALSLRFPF